MTYFEDLCSTVKIPCYFKCSDRVTSFELNVRIKYEHHEIVFDNKSGKLYVFYSFDEDPIELKKIDVPKEDYFEKIPQVFQNFFDEVRGK